jgi:hypothetical protein
MKYEDFEKFIREKCMYETMYYNSDGRQILVIKVWDAYDMVNKALRARLAQPEPLPAKSKGALSHEENKQHNKKILDKFYEENAHLYTAPPQREWVGLTAKDLAEIPPSCYEGAIWADARLKEKNT